MCEDAMTQLIDRPDSAAGSDGPVHCRSQLEVARQQLRAIDAFNRARRVAEDAAASGRRPREMTMDVHRQREVLRRQHRAMVDRLDVQLRLSGAPLQSSTGRRVVLAHRNEWFAGKVSALMRDQGLSVVARVENGADAVGAALAEQPDLVLVEDKLAMVAGEEVVRVVRRYCPDTLLAVQVDYGDRVPDLLKAGASAVFTRQVPPVDVAERLRDLLVG
jgi:CheY-like chemotaxis protein